MLVGGKYRRYPSSAVFLVLLLICFVLFTFHSSIYQTSVPRIPQSLQYEYVDHSHPSSEKQLQGPLQKPVADTSSSPTLEVQPLPSSTTLPLPQEYLQPTAPLSQWCEDRFEIPYLTNLSKSQTEHCDTATSTSSLRCFNSPTGFQGRIDSFCVGGPAFFDVEEKKFKLDCQVKEFSEEDEKLAPSLWQFPKYWYNTGPRALFSQYVGMNASAEHLSELAKFPRKFTIPIRREEPVTNLWHELWEISSLFWTLDVLRLTKDFATGKPLFSLEDIDNTRILIVDDRAEGPYFSLWTMFAKRPITRISKISDIDFRDAENIILPLPGASNPMWHGNTKTHSCSHSSLLDVFARRVMDHYGVDRRTKKGDSPLTLTFIDRRGKRQLLGKESYIQELQRTHPEIEIKMVDFAALSIVEQLKVARGTDILVGVHGAGLTHSLFLPRGSAVVEIIPAEFEHKGFRNMAQLLGHRYFSSHAVSNGTKTDWQYDNVPYDMGRFMELVNIAISSMQNRGLRNDDVT